MSDFPSPPSSPGIPTPASASGANRSWVDRFAALQLPYLNNLSAPELAAPRAPPAPVIPPPPAPLPRPIMAPSFTGSEAPYLPPSRPPAQAPGSGGPFPGVRPPARPVCAKLHCVPLAPPGYHWLKLPAAATATATAQESPPPPPPPPAQIPLVRMPLSIAQAPDAFAPSWGFSLPTGPPLAVWCPIDMAWYTAGHHYCTCPLLPTGDQHQQQQQQATNWTRRSRGLPPHTWLLRPPGYDVFPASYPPPDCLLCRDIGRFGLVRDGCPLHDQPFAN